MRALRSLTAVGAALLPLWLAAPASATCALIHGDPAPGYVGPLTAVIDCRYEWGPEETWAVPAEVTSADFYLIGADDPANGSGGTLRADLQVVPGETLLLVLGGNGEATTVSRGGTTLLVAGGGDGKEPNYAAPGAETTLNEAPGGPLPLYPGDGEVYVEWLNGWHGEKPQPIDGLPPPTGDHGRERCVVPGLGGMRPVAARRQLSAAHCMTGRVIGRTAKRVRRGRVLAQSYLAGSALPAGTAVDLVVGRRP